MSFDFNLKDESVYIVATEEGSMHKCSTSYSEQVRYQNPTTPHLPNPYPYPYPNPTRVTLTLTLTV